MNSRASNGGGVVTDITQQQPGILARLGAAVQVVRTGRLGAGWFGPLEPMRPVAPEGDATGRQFDYPTGFNLGNVSRQGEAVTFNQLRTLADGYDLMRLVIETRKDQLAKLRWNIKPRDAKQQADDRCKAAEALLRRPDRDHPWDEWIRALVEEMLVIDAATVYPRKTRGGGLYSLELIDGSTIKRVINLQGRTPTPDEGPAYQQILKGMPAVDYTREELIYRPRNWRVHKVYGFSPVEQVVMTVNIALRRQMHQMQYFTEGNIPEALIGAPATWSTEQVRQFQAYWDELMEGSTAVRRHAKFVPGDMKYQPTKEPSLKDQFDEWLARVVCFAFSISPTPFIAQVNRATADSAKEAALEEGLAPVMTWVKNLMDVVIEDHMGWPDLEFDWVDEQSIDPATRATVHKTYIDAGVITPDEVREELGRDALTPEQREQAFPKPPPALALAGGGGDQGDGDDPEDDDPDGAAKGQYLGDVAKRKKKSTPRPKASGPAPIDRERRAVQDAVKALTSATEVALTAVAEEACALLAALDGETAKADASEFYRLLAQMQYSGFTTFISDAGPILGDMAADGAGEALAQLNFEGASLDLVNEAAVVWAQQHAAELVGKRLLKDGTIIDNPGAKWRIDEKTREGLQKLVTQAMKDGWSNDRLASEIRSSTTFGAERAETIARTETAKADVEGNLIGYRAAGVTRKRWLLAQSDFCAACAGNSEQGAIGMDKAFQSGAMAPPAHPRCRCDVLPVLEKREQS